MLWGRGLDGENGIEKEPAHAALFQEDAAPEHFLYGGDKSKEKSADRRQ